LDEKSYLIPWIVYCPIAGRGPKLIAQRLKNIGFAQRTFELGEQAIAFPKGGRRKKR
jgi:hypothetical protein